MRIYGEQNRCKAQIDSSHKLSYSILALIKSAILRKPRAKIHELV